MIDHKNPRIEITPDRDVRIYHDPRHSYFLSMGTLQPGDDEQLQRVLKRVYQAGRDAKAADIAALLTVAT